MAKLTQKQVEDWIAQNGGANGVQYSVEQKQIRNPSSDITEQTLQPYVPIEVEVWRNGKTGAELVVRRESDGGFDQIEVKSADPNKPQPAGSTAQAEPPKEKEENGRRYVWKPNPGGPNAGGVWEDVGPAAVKPEDRVGKPTGATRQTSQNGKTVKETEYILPDGTKEWRTQTETSEPDRVGKPTGNIRQATKNGQSVKEVEYVLPDGTKEWRTQTAPADTKDDFPGEPADAPPPNMTPGQVAEGLRKYSAYLSQQVKLWKDSGGKQGIAPEQATKLMDNRIKIAEAAGRESSNLASQQTSIYNGQVTQRGQSLTDTASRRGDANQAYNNNLARFIPNITMMGAGGGKLVADALGASLGANTEYVRNWGGLRETPEVGLPGFLQTIRDSSMAGIQTAANGGPVLTGPVGAPPAQPPAPGMTPAFVPRPPADPAMAAAEAARQAAAATGGATMPGTPTMAPPAPAPAAAAGPNPYGPQPGEMAQPGDPMTQAPSINPATGEPTGLAPLPVNGQFPSTPPPAPAVNPVNAQPITPPAITPPPEAAPFQDEQRSPGYGFPLQTTVESPAQAGDLPLPQPGMLPQSMTPSFLTPMRYGAQYDPRQRAAALGIRPDILELALAG